jgi:hypothetical protein
VRRRKGTVIATRKDPERTGSASIARTLHACYGGLSP